jgi:hypothetical protein
MERPPSFEPAWVDHETGACGAPRCCGQPMADDGDCGMGCCDDYRCEKCGYRCRVEWPD